MSELTNDLSIIDELFVSEPERIEAHFKNADLYPMPIALIQPFDPFDETLTKELVRRYNAHEALEARMQQLEQALTLSKEALTATIQRVGTGYDWNVDPDCVTRLQGDAFEAITNALGQSDA